MNYKPGGIWWAGCRELFGHTNAWFNAKWGTNEQGMGAAAELSSPGPAEDARGAGWGTEEEAVWGIGRMEMHEDWGTRDGGPSTPNPQPNPACKGQGGISRANPSQRPSPFMHHKPDILFHPACDNIREQKRQRMS